MESQEINISNVPENRQAASSGGSRPAKNVATRNGSTLHGVAYHIRLTMIILFRAYSLHRQGKLSQFELKMEVADAGKFDDLKIHYASSSTSEGTVYIQAKHKQPSAKPTKTKQMHPNHPYTPTLRERPSITEATLLTRWNSRGPFSIPKYFISYLEGCEKLSSGAHTFLLCTNATIDSKLKHKLTLQKHGSEDILSFCDDIGATCYSLNAVNEFDALIDALRQASLEKLGQMIVLHVRYNTKIESNYSSLNVYANLIHRCVEEFGTATGKFKLSQRLLTACESSVMGKLRAVLESEFNRLIRAKQSDGSCDNWEDMQISIHKSFFEPASKATPTTMEPDTFYYEKVDHVIRRFCKEFMLVCGSLSEKQLYNSVLERMPQWVDDRVTTHNMLFQRLFDSMKLSHPVPMDLQYLKQQFIRMNVNYCFAKFQFSSQCDLTLWQLDYRYIVVRPDRLQHTELYEFLRDEAVYEHYQYYTTTDIIVYSLIASQTVALLQCKALFIHYAANDFNENICEVLSVLLNFISEVDPSTSTIIMTIDQSKKKVLPEIQRYAKTFKIKFIVIEEVLEARPDEDRFYVRDLTDEVRQQLYAERCNLTLNLFETTVSLRGIVTDDDSLSFVCNLIDNYHTLKNITYIESKQQNFEAIKLGYISRTVLPYGEKNEKHAIEQEESTNFTFMYEQEAPVDDIRFNSAKFSQILESLSFVNDIPCTIPDDFKHHNEANVHIILDEAGTGKTTYFTWLAHALSIDNPLQYVIRINASQYCTDYKRWQASDIKLLDDTTMLRFLYRLIHLTFYVTNVYGFSIKTTDVVRNQGDRAAELLTLDNGKVYVNTCKSKISQLTFAQLTELKVFQDKFNKRQLIILLDALDETAPFYKEFVVKFFGRIAKMKGIRTLFLSTRPYDYMQELKNTFSNGRMYYLKPLTQCEQLRFVHNYLMHELEDYKQCDKSECCKILGLQYVRFVRYLGDLKQIPLFLHMACVVQLPIAKKHIDFKRRTVNIAQLFQTNVDRLTIIEHFIERKLKILIFPKTGIAESAFQRPDQKKDDERFCQNIKKRHILLAMLVLFNEKQLNVLMSTQDKQKIRKMIEEVLGGIEKTGIIIGVHDQKPQFTHRIFAEYFAACWMIDNKNRLKNESFFRSWSCWHGKLHHIANFFNQFVLSKNTRNDLHMAVINQSTDLVQKILSNNKSTALVKDGEGRLPLHLAVIYPSLKIVHLLLNQMSVQSINTVDQLFGWTALDYAFAWRDELATTRILSAGATVNEHILLEQILSNNLYHILSGIHVYGKYLRSIESSSTIANHLQSRAVDYLLNELCIDITSRFDVLNSQTVLEFCISNKYQELAKQFLSQITDPHKISENDYNSIFQLAFKNNAHEIIVYLIDDRNIPLPQPNDIAGLVSAVKYTIQFNIFTSFKIIFKHLCILQNIPLNEETDISDDFCFSTITILNGNRPPKVCCVRSSSNVQLPFPEYHANDMLHDGYVLEALLAYAVCNGNAPILRYIHRKANISITNRLIATIMRLLPKEEGVCHQQSMSAFQYLLDNTTDLDSMDEKGRNLLHMTAQNGCFFMLHCLITRGFDPATINPTNGWNVFHYVTTNEDDDRSDKILTYLFKNCRMIWFGLLDNMLLWKRPCGI
ncbi:uncharacterized protein LOC121597259 isoform X2 [Anopheles merus]|uniref:uncharacterized protein LOC121597259 isoform X2 n=1 Tax=Anopheles merus TaxID=30066 RepID=UPI001BE4B9EF|nr:uncharacterized protein LOC121597259 isoform X2 [Anopheles merus]